MFEKMKLWINRYDRWCHSMGLTPEQKRCCVPIKKEDVISKKEKKDTNKSET